MTESTDDKWLLILVADCNGILWWRLSVRHHATAAENSKYLSISATLTQTNTVIKVSNCQLCGLCWFSTRACISHWYPPLWHAFRISLLLHGTGSAQLEITVSKGLKPDQHLLLICQWASSERIREAENCSAICPFLASTCTDGCGSLYFVYAAYTE